MEPKNTVAIEIASSKIKGAIGSVGADGRVTVLALEEIPATNNVRYGRIQNIREVSGAVNEIVRRLQESPAVAPARISGLAIGYGGRSMTASPTKASLQFPHECEITESHIQRLIYEATRDFMGDSNIEAMVPRMFYVNNAAVHKAAGTFGETLRGEFMTVTCGKETRQNLERLKFDGIAPEDVEYIVRPLAIADLVLGSEDRELGCALVDIGAETTTVSVYKDGTLAFLATIPMGSRLITLDLMAGLGATEAAAENYKRIFADPDAKAAAGGPDPDEVADYVRARAGEIAANIINQIERSGFNAESIQKIILVGGGARLPELAAQISSLCKIAVVNAAMPEEIVFRVAGGNSPDNIDIVALLRAAASSRLEFITAPAKEVTPTDDSDDTTDDTPDSDIDDGGHGYSRPAQQEQNIRPNDDDEEGLLDDDPDDTDNEEGSSHRDLFGFLGFGRKHRKEETAPVEDDYDDYDNGGEGGYAEDDESRGIEGGEPGGDPNAKAKKIIDGIRNRFLDIMSGSADDDRRD